MSDSLKETIAHAATCYKNGSLQESRDTLYYVISKLEQLYLAEEHLTALQLLIVVETAQGNYHEAASLCRRILHHLISNSDRYHSLIHLLFQNPELENLSSFKPDGTNLLEDSLMGQTLSNLAEVYLQAGYSLTISEHLWRCSIKLLQPCKERLWYLNSLASLAGVIKLQGRLSEAEKTMLDVLKLAREYCGDISHQTGIALSNLGNLYFQTDNTDLAKTYLEKAATLIDPAHREFPNLLNNLAAIHTREGNHQKALVLYTRALALSQLIFGQYHANLLPLINNLAQSYCYVQDCNSAEKTFLYGLRIVDEVGIDTANAGWLIANYSKYLLTQCRLDDALANAQQALFILEKHYDGASANLFEPVATLASINLYRRNIESAKILFERAKEYGTTEQNTDLSFLRQLAELYLCTADGVRLEECCQQIAAALSTSWHHQESTLSEILDLADCLLRNEMFASARILFSSLSRAVDSNHNSTVCALTLSTPALTA